MKARTADPDRFAIRSGLVVEISTRPGRVLEEFYDGYDRAFILANEKERIEGFAECLELNHGVPYARLEAIHGPFREVVMVARDHAAGPVIGGANFIAFPLTGTGLAMNLNYIFVLPEHRRRGHFRGIVDSLNEIAGSCFEPRARDNPLIFVEQNDPVRLTSSAYEQDTAHSGLDQWQRLEIWARLGAMVLDFPYVQPALSSSQGTDDSLLYSVLGAKGSRLSACTVQTQLQRFFGISVLKGKPIESSDVASDQLRQLALRCAAGEEISLLNPTSVLERWRRGALADADGEPCFRALAAKYR